MSQKQRQRMKRQRFAGPPAAAGSGGGAVGLLFDKAMQHFQAERLSEALELYRQVLTINPEHAASLYYLGVIALKIGHTDDAIDLLRHFLSLAPDHAEAHDNIAFALTAKGQLVEAAEYYERAIELKPDLIATYANLASVYSGGNDHTRALHAIMRGFKIKETAKLRALFVQFLRHATKVPDSADFRACLVRALSQPWCRPHDIAKTCLALVNLDARIAGAMTRAMEAWPRRLPLDALFDAQSLAATSQDLLLRALLENTRGADISLERFLTQARSALLSAVCSEIPGIEADIHTLGFFSALAQQCFNNEYVFACSDDECIQVAALRDTLTAALTAGKPVDPLALAAVAAYQPLHAWPEHESLLTLSWPAQIDKLLTLQIREPLAERALRASIPRLTPIDDGVSVLVQQQYEENPYPRWVKTAPDERPNTIDRHVQGRFPHVSYHPISESGKIDVLVAGCGTGQHAIDVATSIVGADIVAIDLSLTSLCYAKYRSDALGLKNIEYGHADILRLASLGRSFDMIDCAGVLHHLRDPLEGWRVLLSILRPRGLMRIALYSELARSGVVAARKFIADRGYTTTADDIRRCRQEMLSLGSDSQMMSVTTSPDFFAVSDCRDLLFHVQEHRFTVPQIKTFLTQNGLSFLGFHMRSEWLRHYSSFFPDDPACINLDNWDQFERLNPQLFGAMYQFYVQKQD